MCLDVDVEHDVLRQSNHTARKARTCEECHRTIEPGERYHLEVYAPWGEGRIDEMAMCGHCYGTLLLGTEMTGCSLSWYVSMVHDVRPEDGGFVGDILTHDLTPAQRTAMLRTVIGRRRRWRRRDGSLLPFPKVLV